jgi:translation elongation factor EF-G
MHAKRDLSVLPSQNRSKTYTESTITQHPEYPLERVCTHLYEPFQLNFARHAQALCHEREDVELVASHRGLTIRAETEQAIHESLQVLIDFYGSQISVTPPTIRYHEGRTLEQPWMGLRVRCGSEHLEAVREDLLVREAKILNTEIESGMGAIHAYAPLANLIGYGSALAKLTGGSAQHLAWLSHYAPMESPPPRGDAA